MAKKLKGDSFFLSANDLKTGSVVYYNGDDWSEKIYKAKRPFSLMIFFVTYGNGSSFRRSI